MPSRATAQAGGTPYIWRIGPLLEPFEAARLSPKISSVFEFEDGIDITKSNPPPQADV